MRQLEVRFLGKSTQKRVVEKPSGFLGIFK
jgi:hypothetical protein